MQLFIRILQLVETPIKASHCEEFVVSSHLSQLAVVEDDDAVAFLYGGKAMGDDERRAAVHNTLDRLLNELFGLGID